jgi:hypothetical protein
MRRLRLPLVSILVALSVAGCDNFRDLFTSHSETAAKVGSRELASPRVADMLMRLAGPQVNPQGIDILTGYWVDLHLLAKRVAEGRFQLDSASTLAYVWPQLAELKIQAWHDSLVSRRSPPNEQSADSAYQADQVRVFQHILFSATGPSPADTAAAEALARRLLAQAKRGGMEGFGRLAAEHSSDGSKTDAGFLPPFPREGLVPEFSQAGFALAPGEVSEPVKTQFGWHIIRRPTQEEARGRIQGWLQQMATPIADSIYTAQLAERKELKMRSGAPAAIRSAVSDPGAARKSGKEIASWKGGKFTVADFIKWSAAFPPNLVTQIKSAPDSLLTGFARTITLNEILLHEADSAKATPNPQMHQALVLQFRVALQNLRDGVGLNAPELSDSSTTPVEQKRELAAQKVEAFFDQLGRGEAQFRGIPPSLSLELRSEGGYKIYPAGVARVIELIDERRRADSAAGGAQGAPGPVQPAPGGPPVPQP